MKRPEFQKMINEIKERKVQAIVIKDFSRFSRDYIEAGNLLENVFPFFEIRFISVSDRYDSFETDGSAESLLIPLKNLINSFYGRDISRKVSTAVHTKQLAGEHIPSAIPYGYRKSTTQAYRFEPDPETKDVVTRIFTLRAEGKTYGDIAKILNAEGISSPGHLKWLRGVSKDPKYEHAVWTSPCLKQICMNPTYTGDLVFGRMQTALYLGKLDYHYKYDQSKWRILKDMHEPLVDRETFEKVRQMRLDRTEHWRLAMAATEQDRKQKAPFFRGYLYCGECGRGLYYRRSSRKDGFTGTYFCQNWWQRRCKNGVHSMPQDKLKDIVWHALQDQLWYFADFEILIQKLKSGAETNQQRQYKQKIQSLTLQIGDRQKKRNRLYEDFCDGILSLEEYSALKQKYDAEFQTLNQQMNATLVNQAKLNRMLSSENHWLKQAKEFRNKDQLTKELLEALVERIYLHEDEDHTKRVEIIMKYRDDFDTLKAAWEEIQNDAGKGDEME